MDTCMENSGAVLTRERKTLCWIRDKAANIANLQRLFSSAQNALYRSGGIPHDLSFILDWEAPHDGAYPIVELHVGCLIQTSGNDITNASYFLCVSRDGEPGQRRHVLRKYHFDYASPHVSRRRPHPVFHLQYAGSLPTTLAADMDDGHMDPDFDEPRVFYPPMSLALALQLAFREFPDDYTDKIRTDGGWLSKYVRRDEDCMLRPFYEKCLCLISSKRSVLDHAYEG